jgi:acyl-coenzyme A synthetase/AMP-(fatty) acid ligase
VNLLPSHRTPEFLVGLAAAHPDLYCLADEAVEWCPLETVRYPLALGAARTDPAVPAFPPEQVAAIAFTSGTTGAPAPNVKLWGALAGGARAEAQALEIDRLAGATLVGTVPPQHMYGLESTVLLALQNRFAMEGGRPFYPQDVREALRRVPAPRVLVTTPVHLRALALDDTDLPSLECIVSATAPLAPEAAARAEARYRAPVREIYGFTEAGMVASRRTLEGDAWRLLPGVELRRDGESWWAERGHVPAPARFGDLIDVLDGGRFVLRGRASDVVNVAGKRASLAGLNAQLLGIPGVVDGTFFVPEDDGRGVKRLAALVVAPGVPSRRLLEELRRRVDPAFLPRPLRLVAALPRNATGKLPVDELRAAAVKRGRR